MKPPHQAASLSLAFFLVTTASQAAVIADLRANYNAYSHVNGASANIPDTIGSGHWTFLARSGAAVGASATALVYTTTANSVRNANAYATTGQVLDLPAISNAQLIVGTSEGAPASNQLAFHPGQVGSTFPFLVMRWTPGTSEFGAATIAGNFVDLGVVGNGVTLQIFDQSGASFQSSLSTGNNISFNFSTTLASGSFIDFVFGNNGSYNSDQSAVNISISGVPEPASFSLLLGATALCTLRRNRARTA